MSTDVFHCSTNDEVERHFVSSLEKQLEASSGAMSNDALPGDGAFKSSFHALLSREQQRAVFMVAARSMAFWPRMKWLVGVPPFAFLLPQDDGILRAGGIGKRRRHMSVATSRKVAYPFSPSNTLGKSFFVDELNRSYKILELTPFDPMLPFWKQLHTNARLVADCKLNTSSSKRSTNGIRASNLKTLFPRVNEDISLTTSSAYRSAGIPIQISVSVTGVYSDGTLHSVKRIVGIVRDTITLPANLQ